MRWQVVLPCGSDLEAVREMADSQATFWVDHRIQQQLIQGLNDALGIGPEERIARGRSQRLQAVQS